MVVATDKQGMALAEKIYDSQGDAQVLAEAEKASGQLEAKVDELEKAMTGLGELQDQFEATVIKFGKQLKDLKSANLDDPQPLTELQASLSSFQRLMPITGGPFVELFLGRMNVRFPRKKERLQFKKEYEVFKQKLGVIFVLLCIISLLSTRRWVHTGLQLCLSYYYVTIAIRENILRENGSNIKSWWIQHHYLMVALSVVLVTWAPSDSYREFANPLHLFGMYTSVLQIFLSRYQMARLYTLRALGNAGEMDVVNSDSSAFHWPDSFKVILPMVLFGNAFQMYIGLLAFRIFLKYPAEIHPLMVSVLNLSMFVGNFYTTMLTLREKSKNRKARQKTV